MYLYFHMEHACCASHRIPTQGSTELLCPLIHDTLFLRRHIPATLLYEL
jgi:hypothetical protein